MEPDQAADNQVESVPPFEEDLSLLPRSLQLAITTSHKAGVEDKAGNYGKAIQLYWEAEKYILHAIQYDEDDEKCKEEYRQACFEYRTRANELLTYFGESRPHAKRMV